MSETTYQAGTENRELDIINLDRLEAEAAKIIPTGAFGYIQGGAGDEWTMRRNRESFDHRQIAPRVLADLEKPDLKVSFMGIDLNSPIIMAPSAAHGLAHAEGEKASARGVAEAGSLMCISSYANTSIEETAEAGGSAPRWFQLYMSKDDEFNRFLLDKAKAAGCRAIILTADATVGGNREADAINHFTFPLPMANLAPLWGRQRAGHRRDIRQGPAKDKTIRCGKAGLPFRLAGHRQGHTEPLGCRGGHQGRSGGRLRLQPRRTTA